MQAVSAKNEARDAGVRGVSFRTPYVGWRVQARAPAHERVGDSRCESMRCVAPVTCYKLAPRGHREVLRFHSNHYIVKIPKENGRTTNPDEVI